MTPAYDTAEGIAGYLTSLEGLCELRRERSQAGHERKERLNEFLVLGRWWFDTCGNMRFLFEGSPFSLRLQYDPVMTLEQAHDRFSNWRWSASGAVLPDVNSVCACCGDGWNLRNAHDVVEVRGEISQLFHSVCRRSLNAEVDRTQFYRIFERAGFRVVLQAVKNGYWGDESSEPWFMAQSGAATVRIGWRKRVISIDWESMHVPLPDLFADQDVTKGPYGVHAWSEDKAVEYLKRLIPALQGSDL